jgi:cytochrome c oxidase subunit II
MSPHGLLLSAVFLAQSESFHPIGNIFRPQATPAAGIYGLSLMVLGICAAVFIIVGGLLTFTIIRFRRRPGDDREPPQVYGSNRIELAWTVIPVLIVLVLTLATAHVVVAIQDKAPSADALRVTVVGHQWWWEFRYPSLKIITANELHVPLSTTSKPALTFLKLESADVAHSFWVPQLAGKTDVIPNQNNSMWIDPHQQGTYLGNCAEYCGTQHANMALRVVVQAPAEFKRWVAEQQKGALQSDHAATLLSLSCINCHSISGTSAKGTFGPDLSHLMSRSTLGSGVIPNTPANLRAWIQDPQVVKPGNLMPNMQLKPDELDRVVEYLLSLK